MAKNVSMRAPLAALKRGLAKKLMSSIGVRVRRSHTMKAVSSTAATAKAPSTSGSVQPWAPSMIAHTRATRPTMDSTAPRKSTRGAAGSRDVGTKSCPPTRATTTTGTLTRKTEPHQKCSRSQPPVTGPMATAMPAVADQMAMAWARSRRSVNTLVMIESVAGMISAAPMPMIARVAMRWLALVAKAEAIDAEPMIVRPMARAPRRPNRSPSEPIVSSRPANTRMYESTTHWSWLVDASRSRCNVGRATFTIVLSITISSRLRHITASTIQRRGSRVAAGAPVGTVAESVGMAGAPRRDIRYETAASR